MSSLPDCSLPVSISSLARHGSSAVGSASFLSVSSFPGSSEGVEVSFDLKLSMSIRLKFSNLNGFVHLIDDRVHDVERISRLPRSYALPCPLIMMISHRFFSLIMKMSLCNFVKLLTSFIVDEYLTMLLILKVRMRLLMELEKVCRED